MLAERIDPDGMSDSPGQPSPQKAAAVQPNAGKMPHHSGDMGVETAHELANLLTVLLGSLEPLRRQPLDERGQRQLSRAEWGARQVARLTRQVLSQAQGREDAAEIVDLNAVVDGFATAMDGHMSEGARVATELALGSLPVRLDAGLLDFVLLNLVRNAADATPGGGEVVLRTRGPRLDGLGKQLTAEVSVSDDGTGMPPDVAQRAPEAFFTTKPPGNGTGLGPWMANGFASDCGGTVKIETAPGQGTTIRLVFPYAGESMPE